MVDIKQESLPDGFPAEEAVELGGVSGVERVPAVPESRERQIERSEVLYQKIVSQAQTNASDDVVTSDAANAELDAKTIMALADMKAQVERLVQLAELRGVVYAVNVAKKLDFYVLDQVHDQLANHLYDTLLSKGMIEKE